MIENMFVNFEKQFSVICLNYKCSRSIWKKAGMADLRTLFLNAARNTINKIARIL